ncbi:ABC-F family ATP-binding cassette domain-containing protein [Romboutsia sp. 1001216sp1]|uniref:ABC-F family ATP-binding cassette domain-containing protein n=1 Tax=Romboutsia sp. 1001216sp1 TaxID=2986997 RepID=UPI00232F1339|nr:ABC-F family ATP-binding cassette domain-containing protein [Romboutsia sp. 1001216sp1]MDB8804309.1 ABC-F family ATP-binding cassette domain-containing protein [Romboutsia sp. 1001216sp1]MDB8807733.1 ABC-F family ATP-binding cassette domain-containing protein [Romboutsia sp. 1001216sp1]MDB8809955.1 ABC-F family ATP-binding cassette domain-containing protein [Romboutsia sp. 1001216sp1]MDB8815705.1 ABC-F family ATP-binding cassette domain-containing protein [Romboutsia sp. 1001216sp1]MDB88194
MNLMTLENICKSYSEKTLLENISFGINEGEKIGIIGVNGTGKSTLLKIIAGVEVPDSGTVTKANRVRVEYLPQNPDYNEEFTVLQQVFKGTSSEMKLLLEYQETLDKLNKTYNEDINNKLISLQEKIDTLGLWDLESEAKMILTKLGITNFSQKVKELSGGQRKRISLASALITPCDLLILDEPTNHLDNETIDYLEEYLNSRRGSLVMITHDRYFLDRVSNRIIELDKGRLFSYDGNYSLFLEKKMERLALEASMEEKRQNLMRKELAWVRRGAKARTTKQKARLQRFDDLVNQDIIKPDEQMDISVGSTRLGNKIIEIHNISKSFDGKCLINNLDYTIARTDRIGIVGKNGMGKSTLINILNGKLSPDSGHIEVGETVKIGCFSQDDSHMHPDMRAIDYVKEGSDYIETSDGSKISASQMCERFLFNSTLQYSLINKLSGGERRRLHLLRTLMTAPNVLLLDEPTNDLDIETLNRLEDYLDEFRGVVITVSHDRYFLDRICNKIFAYEGMGNIHIYTGNYSDYQVYKEVQGIEFEEEKIIKENSTPKKEKPKSAKKLKFSYNEQREFETIDSDIEKLEQKIEQLESDSTKYATDFVKLQELLDEKANLEKELEFKYERWEYLNNLAEEIENSKN